MVSHGHYLSHDEVMNGISTLVWLTVLMYSYPWSFPRFKQVLDILGEELPCVRYDGWGNLTPSGYFKFNLGGRLP